MQHTIYMFIKLIDKCKKLFKLFSFVINHYCVSTNRNIIYNLHIHLALDKQSSNRQTKKNVSSRRLGEKLLSWFFFLCFFSCILCLVKSIYHARDEINNIHLLQPVTSSSIVPHTDVTFSMTKIEYER